MRSAAQPERFKVYSYFIYILTGFWYSMVSIVWPSLKLDVCWVFFVGLFFFTRITIKNDNDDTMYDSLLKFFFMATLVVNGSVSVFPASVCFKWIKPFKNTGTSRGQSEPLVFTPSVQSFQFPKKKKKSWRQGGLKHTSVKRGTSCATTYAVVQPVHSSTTTKKPPNVAFFIWFFFFSSSHFRRWRWQTPALAPQRPLLPTPSLCTFTKIFFLLEK